MDPAVQAAINAGRVPDDVSAAYLNETRDSPAIAGIIFVTVLTFLVVAARCFSRVLLLKRFGLDDGLAVLGFVILIPFVVLAIILIRLGSGRHYAYIQYVLSLDTVRRTEVLDFVAHLIYTTALLACRISGLAFYHRICGKSRKFKIAIIATGGVIVAGYIPQMLLIVFHCLPVTGLWPYAWQVEDREYNCLAWGVVYSVNSSVSLFCDFLLFGIPIAMLYTLEMPRRRKIQLACILLPGTLVVGISIARLVLVILGQWQADQSWSYNPMLAVETSEISATLIALSIPGIKPLWERVFSNKSHHTTAGTDERSRSRSIGMFDRFRSRQDRSHVVSGDKFDFGSQKSMSDEKSGTSGSSNDGILVEVDFRIAEEFNGRTDQPGTRVLQT